MKTVVIWNEIELGIRFFVVEKDLSHLNLMYINSVDTSDLIQDEINQIVYDRDGKEIVEMTTSFPIEEVKNGARVIIMGFLP